MSRCSDLAHNSLTSLSSSALLASVSLVSLNMSHNLLASLASGPPALLPSLTSLVLSSNPLSSVSLCSLSGMQRLEELQVRPAEDD